MRRREFIAVLGGAVAAWPPTASCEHILNTIKSELLITGHAYAGFESFRPHTGYSGGTAGRGTTPCVTATMAQGALLLVKSGHRFDERRMHASCGR